MECGGLPPRSYGADRMPDSGSKLPHCKAFGRGANGKLEFPYTPGWRKLRHFSRQWHD